MIRHVEVAGAPIAWQPEDVRDRHALGTATAPARYHYHSTVLLVRLDGQAIAVSTMKNGLRIVFPPKIGFPTWRGFPSWNHGSTSYEVQVQLFQREPLPPVDRRAMSACRRYVQVVKRCWPARAVQHACALCGTLPLPVGTAMGSGVGNINGQRRRGGKKGG